MIGYFITLIGRFLLTMLILLVVLPFVWIVSCPVILIAAIFVPGPYKFNVARGFWSVSKIWLSLLDVRHSP